MRELNGERLVTRSEIATLAGVNRPAVTNWAGRHADFPSQVDSVPTGTGAADLFRADEVAEWLDARRIPSGKRRLDEPEGTTYGERFRAALTGRRTSPKRVLMRYYEQVGGEERGRRDGETLELLIGVIAAWAVRGGELPLEKWRRPGGGDPWSVLRQWLETDGWSLPRAPETWRGGAWQDRVLAGAARALAEAEWSRDGAAEALDWLIDLRVDEASAGKGKSKEIVTPPGIRRLMAGLLAEDARCDGTETVFDPYCRTGEILDACAESFPGAGVSGGRADGAAVTATEKWLARMRLFVRDIPGRVLESDVTRRSDFQGRYTRVVSNPPFNERIEPGTWENVSFRYGRPPQHSGNFAWLQLAVQALEPGGRAAVLMANIAAQSASPVESAMRGAMVEDGAVEALIALPPQLFGQATGVPVTLWLLRAPTGAPGDVLFVDAGSLGTMAGRVRRVLSAQDLTTVADAYRRWRASRVAGEPFQGRPGFSVSLPAHTLKERGWLLSPAVLVAGGGRSSTALREADSGEETETVDAVAEIGRLAGRLAALDARARESDLVADAVLAGLEKHRWTV
ncbi:N-6 DNA methylase [Streptomyces laurentii]|uniref:N-6 DNA methylase n=1 Tax=Streptomyces laurentii TaxID=39478 RepID=UPI0036850C77